MHTHDCELSTILCPSVISFCWFMMRHLFEILLIHFPSGMFGIWILCCWGIFHCSGGKSNVYKSISSQCILSIMISYQFIVTDYISFILQPIFHDGTKEWSCCKKRSHDFSLFLEIPGWEIIIQFFPLFCSFLF